jgi:hypothetical protein
VKVTKAAKVMLEEVWEITGMRDWQLSLYADGKGRIIVER